MDIIISTANGYTQTIYVITLPSGNVAAVEAAATFGELAVFLGLIMVAALLVALLVRSWKQ